MENEAEALVLGAFGCGAFHNPPFIVAEAFRQVMISSRYINSFKEVIFAIKRTVQVNFAPISKHLKLNF